MASNQTSNYQLNLWEPGDDFLREEFNENSAKVDAALGELAGRTTYVPLLDVITKTQAGQVDLDVSGIDFTRWKKVTLSYDHEGDIRSDISVLLNGLTDAVYSNYLSVVNGDTMNSNTRALFLYARANFSDASGCRSILIELMPATPHAIHATLDAVTTFTATAYPRFWHRYTDSGFTTAVSFATLKKISLVGTVPKGARLRLWGVS